MKEEPAPPPRLVDVRCRACAEPVSCPRGHQDGLMDVGEVPESNATCAIHREELESRGVLWCSCGWQAHAHRSEGESDSSSPVTPEERWREKYYDKCGELNKAEAGLAKAEAYHKEWSLAAAVASVNMQATISRFRGLLQDALQIDLPCNCMDGSCVGCQFVCRANAALNAREPTELVSEEEWIQEAERLCRWEISVHGAKDVFGYMLRLIAELRRTIGRSEYNRKQIHAVRVNCEAESDKLRRGLGATARELYRWQHDECVEGDYIDKDGVVVSDPHRERDEAVIALKDEQFTSCTAMTKLDEARVEIKQLKEAYKDLRHRLAVGVALFRRKRHNKDETEWLDSATPPRWRKKR